jgi:hypothetical protein
MLQSIAEADVPFAHAPSSKSGASTAVGEGRCGTVALQCISARFKERARWDVMILLIMILRKAGDVGGFNSYPSI